MSGSPTAPESFNEDLRVLLEAVRTADLGGVDLEALSAQVRELTALVEPHVVHGLRMQAGLHFEIDSRGAVSDGPAVPGPGGMPPRQMASMAGSGAVAMMPYSPYSGLLNPLSPPVTLEVSEVDGRREVTGSARFRHTFNGPPDAVHGGVIAAVLDEVLGMACLANERGGFTGTLTVAYRSPTPLDRPVAIRGWVESVEGRKTFAKGTFCDGDRLLVEAEGIFITT